jgi:hypothetical protein
MRLAAATWAHCRDANQHALPQTALKRNYGSVVSLEERAARMALQHIALPLVGLTLLVYWSIRTSKFLQMLGPVVIIGLVLLCIGAALIIVAIAGDLPLNDATVQSGKAIAGIGAALWVFGVCRYRIKNPPPPRRWPWQ